MNERLKTLRKTLGLTQQEFADKVGVSRNNIAGYEVGKSKIGSSAFNLICKEFNVNEEWLKDGKGEMFTPNEDDELKLLMKKYNLTEMDAVTIEKFVKLKPQDRASVINYMVQVAECFDKNGNYIQEKHLEVSEAISSVPATEQKEPNADEASPSNKSVEEAEEAYIKSRSLHAQRTDAYASSIGEGRRSAKA